MKAVIVFSFVTIFYLLGGCAKDQPFRSDAYNQQVDITQKEKQFIKKDNEFGIHLLQKIAAEEKDNVLISPFSTSIALSMTLNGAKGKTKAALKDGLQKQGVSQQMVNSTYKKLLEALPSIDSKVTSQIANSIWFRNTFAVNQAFIDTNKHYFNAQVRDLDFSSPSAKETINNWVKDNTDGKMDKIINQINDKHVMFLINALYFKGKWANAFDPEKTSKQSFTKSDGSTAQVPMMHYEETNFYYHETDSLEVAEIPYGNGSYRMTILLPKKGNVDNVIKNLTTEKWRSLVTSVDSSGRRELYIPKFEIEYEKKMKKFLQDMGMAVAFDPNNANFKGINEKRGKQLYIDQVKQKTRIKVNEEGTEAAAATSVSVGVTSMPPVMRVDHPFIMAIRNKQTNTILFLGRISTPTL